MGVSQVCGGCGRKSLFFVYVLEIECMQQSLILLAAAASKSQKRNKKISLLVYLNTKVKLEK